MKIIFLDIDGVLNYVRMKDSIKTPSGYISNSAVILLNKLTDETSAKIVITSTWRLDPIHSVKQSLIKGGVSGDIIGATPNGCHYCLRGNEIRQWLMENLELIGDYYYNFNNYVILDDDSDMLLGQQNNYIQVDNIVGLTENIIYKAKRVLNVNNDT